MSDPVKYDMAFSMALENLMYDEVAAGAVFDLTRRVHRANQDLRASSPNDPSVEADIKTIEDAFIDALGAFVRVGIRSHESLESEDAA